MSKENKISMDIAAIREVLPHEYPFLMVDRVDEIIPGETGTAYKNISYNEPQFMGHFPDAPIMPGVLQVEALAQLCCLIMLNVEEYKVGYKGILTGLDGVKYRRMVVPGDKLILEATKAKFRFPFGKFDVKATVDGEITVSGQISFAMIKNEDL